MKLVNSKKSIIKQEDQESDKQRQIGDYLLVKTLGLGTFGLVKLAIHSITQEKVAIKILEKSKIIDVADVERVSREIHILKLIRHKHVIQLYEIIETKKYIFLVMEFCDGGELFDYIVKHQKLSEIEACKFIQELISGIEYIHKLNIVHRDLKPENLLLDYQKSLKIVDFGLSNTYKQGEQLKTACGSPCYAAPEMIQGNKYNSLLVDIWSCGVILFASICGYLPFEDVNTSALYKKILNGEYQIPNFVSPEGTSFLKGILNINPEKRFNLEQIKSHPWFKLYRRSHPIPPGIIIGFHRIPIDNNIVLQLKEKGFNEDYVKICLDANKQNNVTTSYFLLIKRHLKNGGISTADINSVYFDSKLLEPIQRTQKGRALGFLDESMLKTLNSNRSQSNQTRINQKMHTQQNRGGHYYIQEEKFNKSIQLKQSYRQDSLDSDDEFNKSYSQNVTQNAKKQKVRTESNYNAESQLNQTTMIAGKRQSISPAKANLILQYIKQQKKLTPTSIRNSCQQKPNLLTLNNQRNIQTIYDHDGLKIMNSNKQQTTDSKRNVNNQWMPQTLMNHYQLLLQLNSRKGSRDLSAPHSTKCANNPKSSQGPQPESYEINCQEYHEINLIAEGGYGFIWRAIETKTRKFCVIKKIICQSKEAIEQAQQELDQHRKLQHSNIVKCYNGAIKFNKKLNQTIAYMVLELCEGGTLIDLLKRYNEKKLTEQQIIQDLKQLVQAIKYLHTQKPSITHRDLKVENVLLHNKVFKVCDFGSASTEKIDLNLSNKQQISQYEDNFAKYTTEVYRPPEMTDLYLKYEINEKVDIWMLGCILYTMCFYNSPFQESSKLAIVEPSYIIPKDNKYTKKMIDLIGIMLQPNPKDRASIFEIEEILKNYETLTQIQNKNVQDDDFGEFQAGDHKPQQQKTVQYDDLLI